MGRRKVFDTKIQVSLSKDTADWLDDKVKEGTFSSMAHGVRVALKELMKKGGE